MFRISHLTVNMYLSFGWQVVVILILVNHTTRFIFALIVFVERVYADDFKNVNKEIPSAPDLECPKT